MSNWGDRERDQRWVRLRLRVKKGKWWNLEHSSAVSDPPSYYCYTLDDDDPPFLTNSSSS